MGLFQNPEENAEKASSLHCCQSTNEAVLQTGGSSLERECPDGALRPEEATNPGSYTHPSARWCQPIPASPGQHWGEETKILFKTLLLPVWFWQMFLCRGSHNSGPGPALAGFPLSVLGGHIYSLPAPWEHHLSLSLS